MLSVVKKKQRAMPSDNFGVNNAHAIRLHTE